MALYPHNQAAYEKAKRLLEEKGKTAIIHPTGTGKSFIAFALCEEHPKENICWLSPSEYIFRTQLENWEGAGGIPLQNITFLTYAKLMQMEQEEIEQIHPDYIILDEFHRCGAKIWGQGVDCLLRTNPDSKILGLSATNIRYLDNQRDMAEELFDGSVASLMTLGEAIVKGILSPPKYVLSVYSYEKDLEEYEKKVQTVKNKAVRDRADKYLQKLRRTIEQAEGLDVIFQKHITEKNGKYIAFCSRKEHADEMMKQVPQWFGQIDKNPHVYCVYSKDPYNSKAFQAFQEDRSEHLKLLFCIDMLNEGIHVADIDGIILFRPTVSPTVYKQQIGRVMCTGSKKDTVIIDVVNNIGNLYSIGAIEEEMAECMEYLAWSGESSIVVNDSFTIIDEVEDCRKLFEELEHTLKASWELMYLEAKQYYEAFGELNVPASYVSSKGYHLGAWIVTQRGIYHGKKEGSLSEEQIRLLDSIGMNWEYRKELSWETMFSCAAKYYEEHKNLDIPANYITEEGHALGWWYRRNITSYRNGTLSNDRRIKLESIGIKKESVNDRNWKKCYEAAVLYKTETGNLNVASDYVTRDGITLGTWLNTQRYFHGKGTLNKEREKLLDAIGMNWNKFDEKWNVGFQHLKDYQKTYHHIKVPVSFQTEDGFKLGAWVATQKSRKKQGKLENWKIEKLLSVDFVFNKKYQYK